MDHKDKFDRCCVSELIRICIVLTYKEMDIEASKPASSI